MTWRKTMSEETTGHGGVLCGGSHGVGSERHMGVHFLPTKIKDT